MQARKHFCFPEPADPVSSEARASIAFEPSSTRLTLQIPLQGRGALHQPLLGKTYAQSTVSSAMPEEPACSSYGGEQAWDFREVVMKLNVFTLWSGIKVVIVKTRWAITGYRTLPVELGQARP